MTMMGKLNFPSVREGIRRLDLEDGDTFVEIGAGHGAGLREIANLGVTLNRIVCVEISEHFRKELQRTIDDLPRELPVEVSGEDCREMPYLEDGSVDKIFGMNLVYFLDPLPHYLQEMHRVLKPGGVVVFGCKFYALPEGTKEFVNTKPKPIVKAMEEAGFNVTVSKVEVDSGKDRTKNFIEIRGQSQDN